MPAWLGRRGGWEEMVGVPGGGSVGEGVGAAGGACCGGGAAWVGGWEVIVSGWSKEEVVGVTRVQPYWLNDAHAAGGQVVVEESSGGVFSAVLVPADLG